MTSLATVPHVRTRLAEIYRGAQYSDLRVADTSVMVIVELPRGQPGHELELALRALDVAEAMRTVFAGEEIVAQLTTRRFAALVRSERTDALTKSLLAGLLERSLGGGVQPRLWVERLPGSADGVARVLAGLSE